LGVVGRKRCSALTCSFKKDFVEEMLNTSPNSPKTLCLSAFQMVRCFSDTSPHTSPSPHHLCTNVGGHAILCKQSVPRAERPNCARQPVAFPSVTPATWDISHLGMLGATSYALLRRWEASPPTHRPSTPINSNHPSTPITYHPSSPITHHHPSPTTQMVRCMVRCLVRCLANTSPGKTRFGKGISRILVRCWGYFRNIRFSE